MTKPGDQVVFYKIKVHLVQVDSWKPNILKAEQTFYKKCVGTYLLYQILGHPKFATLILPTAMFIKWPVILIESIKCSNHLLFY